MYFGLKKLISLGFILVFNSLSYSMQDSNAEVEYSALDSLPNELKEQIFIQLISRDSNEIGASKDIYTLKRVNKNFNKLIENESAVKKICNDLAKKFNLTELESYILFRSRVTLDLLLNFDKKKIEDWFITSAAYKGSKHLHIIKFLLNNLKFNANAKNDIDDTALINAVKANNIDTVRLLLAYPSVDVHTLGDRGFNALSFAMFHQHEELIELLKAYPNIECQLIELTRDKTTLREEEI